MNIYFENREKIISKLKVIWDYMNLDMPISKADVIIGCGCSDLLIPIKCAKLFKENYAPLIIFSGGLGKITDGLFNKTEAEIYKDIAIREGVPEDKILIENRSTNTGDNFKFSLKLLNDKKIKADKIIIVHHACVERRTLSSAKAVMKNKELTITTPDITFEEFINKLESDTEKINDKISVIVGDIQRIVIYPQFGWQIENEISDEVIDAYNFLKNLGFNKFIISKEDIQNLIDKHGLVNNQKPNYFN